VYFANVKSDITLKEKTDPILAAFVRGLYMALIDGA